MSTSILLDTDIGSDVDDALALALALRSPEVALTDVTTVGARTTVRAALARRLLDIAGRQDVMVTPGLGRPLPSQTFSTFLADGLWLGHEGEGLLTPEELAALPTDPDCEDGVRRIVDTVLSGAATTIVTIGPVTNVAAALRAKPEIADHISRIVCMGGSVLADPRIGGARLSPLAEFNLNADREAASVVLSSGVPITLMPIEITLRTYFTAEDVERLRAGDALAQALARLLDVWAPVFRRLTETQTGDSFRTSWVCHLHDPSALLVLIEPDLLSLRDVRIDVREDESGILTTKAADDGTIGISVVDDIDEEGVRSFILERLLGRE